MPDWVSALGEPSHYRDGIAIFKGDCVELFSRIEEPVVATTITSPPYNIGKEYETPLPLEAYLLWCGKWMTEVHRVTQSSGSFWLNLGYVSVENFGKAVPLAYLLWDKSPFFLQQEVIWHYGAGVSTKATFAPRNEKFLWFLKNPKDYTFNLDAVRDPDVKYPLQKKNGKLRCNPLGKNPGDVWAIPKVTSGKNRSSRERMPHPAQFPEAVIERIMLATSNPGDWVLDPFLGSGTTASVARRLGRNCVGFELREDYIETSIRRLNALDSQPSMLV